MKAHFGKGDYDFVKFNGKTKVSRDSFWKRKDRVWFVMLGRKYNSHLIQSIEDYLLANFIVETKGYIGNFNDQNYFDWMKRMSRLETLFKNEATKLFEDRSLDVLNVPDNSHPKLLKEYLGKRMSKEQIINVIHQIFFIYYSRLLKTYMLKKPFYIYGTNADITSKRGRNPKIKENMANRNSYGFCCSFSRS